jgi:hypothetical protein
MAVPFRPEISSEPPYRGALRNRSKPGFTRSRDEHASIQKDHEWVRTEGDEAAIGIARTQLGALNRAKR